MTKEVDAPVDYKDADGKSYVGTFTLKTSLSVRDEAEIGRRRRAIMGPVVGGTVGDELDYYFANGQAELAVRPTSAPDWFKKAAGDDLTRPVLDACIRAMETALLEHLESAKKDAGEAHKVARAGAEKGKA